MARKEPSKADEVPIDFFHSFGILYLQASPLLLVHIQASSPLPHGWNYAVCSWLSRSHHVNPPIPIPWPQIHVSYRAQPHSMCIRSVDVQSLPVGQCQAFDKRKQNSISIHAESMRRINKAFLRSCRRNRESSSHL